MLKEAIQEIRDLTKTGLRPEPIEIDGVYHRVALAMPDGTITWVDVDNLRNHYVDDFDSFVSAINRWGTKATVWHRPHCVVALLDDEERRNQVHWTLERSEPIKKLQEIASKQNGWIDATQKGLIWWLRHEMADTVPPTLVPMIRKLDFRRRNDGTSEIKHGKESLGKSVESALVGADEIPEVITIDTPYYQNTPPQICRIRVSLDIDPVGERFTIAPMAEDLAKAEREAHAYLQDELVGELGEVAEVFAGTP